MNASTGLMTIRWLIRDTFRQSVASRISWVMLLFSGVAILFCLSTGIAGEMPEPERPPGFGIDLLPEKEAKKLKSHADEGTVRVIQGHLTLLFGTIKVPLSRTRVQAVRQIQLVLVGGVADTVGLLFALIWTAGFLPAFLEPANATVLLAKPVPRWSLLTGKFLGVVVFVMVQAMIFVLGTWFALGIRTQVWDPLYLLCIPLLLVHFAIFFSFSTFLAVWTRSTVTCVFGTILFWVLCWAMNFGHHAFLAQNLSNREIKVQPEYFLTLAADPHAGLPGSIAWGGVGLVGQHHPARQSVTAPASSVLVEVGYWIMPKPADLGILLSEALQAEPFVGQLPEYKILRKHGAFQLHLSVLASLLAMVLFLALAGYEFVTTDY